MDTAVQTNTTSRYAKCIEASKRVRWEIDRDVIRGREFDYTRKFLPDKLAQMAVFNLTNAGKVTGQLVSRSWAEGYYAVLAQFVSLSMPARKKP